MRIVFKGFGIKFIKINILISKFCEILKLRVKKNVYENFILLMNIVLICYDYGNIKWWYFKGYYYMIIVNWIKFLNGCCLLD